MAKAAVQAQTAHSLFGMGWGFSCSGAILAARAFEMVPVYVQWARPDSCLDRSSVHMDPFGVVNRWARIEGSPGAGSNSAMGLGVNTWIALFSL